MEKIFNNTQNAFELKSNRELDRALFLFKMIANPSLVKIGTKLTNVALNFNLPVETLIRKTIFDQFCGGVSVNDCLKVVDLMYTKGVSSVLDYSVEGKAEESQFDATLEMTLKTVEFAQKSKAIPYAVFKPTGVGRIELYEKIGNKTQLTPAENQEWDRTVARFEKICKAAYDKDVMLLIDAEESWMQDAADDLCEKMMRLYNKEKAIIYNTAQFYRWDRLDYMKKLHEKAKKEGFHIGMKVVRGAYMEKENIRAQERGYKSPICESKKATDENYDAGIKYMTDNLDCMAIFAGTHNENSAYYLMNIMQNRNISKDSNKIWFGQLYGMSDNMSYNLSKHGYNIAKYLPFGPVKEVVPYLIRRAEENTSVAGQTSRELNLIQTEKNRRKNLK